MSEMARAWEQVSDAMLRGERAKTHQGKKRAFEGDWVDRLDPQTPIYRSKDSAMTSNLGFNHLVDELNNALNPESGLPRNLLLRPEQMQQMGMEKAVRHVDAINKWRESQRAAANAELANKALAIREYPDTPELPNPKGLRWVELGGTPLPQDKISVVKTDSGWRVKDKFQTPRFKEDPQGYATQEEALAAHAARRDITDLEKQLKYEGDVMGHCVGGYCPDVESGRSRIFSLRDAKGEPHVTVEARPSEEGFMIQQIKGKANLRPKDEYLPFVQDFVRNPPTGGRWADVRDFENTGLARFTGDSEVAHQGGRFAIPQGDYTRAELEKMAREAGMSEDEIPGLLGRYKFAEGGAVRAPAGNWRRMDLGGTIGYLMEG